MDWKGKNYPSTLVHKNCELIKTPKEPANEFSGPSTWFRCRPCSEISAVLLVKDSKTQEFENANANKLLRSDDEVTALVYSSLVYSALVFSALVYSLVTI